ncbi:MAG: HigA family addiction module antidote protein [Truepera sp.]|nr:HigA family addiction module antidote protein [Truepera sp.]
MAHLFSLERRRCLRGRDRGLSLGVVMEKLPPIHPGEILLEEFLKPLGISQYRLAKDIGVSARRINEIVHGQRAISPDTALRLARYFSMSERFWLNLQSRYDLEVEKDRSSKQIEQQVRVLAAQA